MRFEKSILKGNVLQTYVSVHPDPAYDGEDYMFTKQVDLLMLTIEGVRGDRHYGVSTPSGGRFTTLYAKGTAVRNNRMWSAISPTEVAQIDTNLGLEGRLKPEHLGVNFLIDGIPQLTQLPPMTYLVFSSDQTGFKPGQAEDVVLVVYAEALPCVVVGEGIGLELGDESIKGRFPKAAIGIRGTTGWIEKSGIIRPGQAVYALTPTGKD